LVVIALGFVPAAAGLAPASAAASSGDVVATHAYLEANYAVLRTVVKGWPSDEAKVTALERKIRSECPSAGAGSPQNEEAQKLSTEVVGALWATVYEANASAIRRFVRAVGLLRWSNPAVTRSVRHYTRGLREMSALEVPHLCEDVRAWGATGFETAPARTDKFDRHVNAIEVKEPSQRLLAPYEQGSDHSLAARIAHLSMRFGELEFTRGQSDWNALLEALALNQ